MAWFVAFYSYKGGVGRTLALANVAHALAVRGKRVVVVDMDLEAPSLNRFPGFQGVCEGNAPGVMDYAAAFQRTGKCPPIGEYLHQCDPPADPAIAAEMGATGGRLWLMPAGSSESSFHEGSGALDWRRLHPRLGTMPFVEGLRAAIEDAVDPHYVLVDSRTGLSDVGGLSTHVLANEVVLVFNLTRDCLAGTTSAYRSMFAASEEREQRFPFVLVASPVPAGSDSLVKARLDEAARLMKGALTAGRRIVRVDYHPDMVLSDVLAVDDPDRHPAAARFHQLRERLQRDNPDEVFTTVELAQALRDQGQFDAAVRDLKAFTDVHPDNADGFDALGTLLLQGGRASDAAVAFRAATGLAARVAVFHRRLGEALLQAGDAEGARIALMAAREHGDNSRELHLAQARTFDDLGQADQALAARRAALGLLLGSLATEPVDHDPVTVRAEFVEVVGHAPLFSGFDAGAFWDLVFGSPSMPIAQKRQMVRAVPEGRVTASTVTLLQRILAEENKKYSETFGGRWEILRERLMVSTFDPSDPAGMDALLRGDPDDAVVFRFFAGIEGSSVERQVSLLRRAVGADPEDAGAWDSLGTALGKAAKAEEDADKRVSTFREAINAHARASSLRPDWDQALNNWGVALGKLASEHEGSERVALLREACGRYAEAVRHKPDTHEVLSNWGVAIIHLACEAGADERLNLLEEARLHIREAYLRSPGTAEYNLACIESLLGNLDEAQGHLLGVVERRPADIEMALADDDFENLFEARPELLAQLKARRSSSGGSM